MYASIADKIKAGRKERYLELIVYLKTKIKIMNFKLPLKPLNIKINLQLIGRREWLIPSLISMNLFNKFNGIFIKIDPKQYIKVLIKLQNDRLFIVYNIF